MLNPRYSLTLRGLDNCLNFINIKSIHQYLHKRTRVVVNPTYPSRGVIQGLIGGIAPTSSHTYIHSHLPLHWDFFTMPRTNTNQRPNLLKEMPFFALTDFQLKWENETCRQMILEKMDSNGFIEFLTNAHDYNDSKSLLDDFRYYDTDEINDVFKRKDLTKIIHMNTRMLSKNRGKIIGFLKSFDVQPDLILLSEIGKEGYRYLNHVFPNYTFEYDIPVKNTYGGVAILGDENEYTFTSKDEIKLEKQCKCSNCQYENKWVETTINNDSYIIGCIYRHPNGNIDHFMQALSKSLEKIPKNVTCIIGGDLNINLIDIHNNDVSNYVTELLSKGFMPNIYLPTRITDNSCTLIDHFFTRLPNKLVDTKVISGNIFSDISDHLPLFLGMPRKSNASQNRPFVRIISDKSLETFRRLCSSQNWDTINDYNEIDDKFDHFQGNLINLFNQSFPLVRKSRKRAKDKKWITSGIRISIRHKDRLYKKKIRSPTIHNKTEYNRYKNILDSTIKEAEEIYYRNLFNDTKSASNKLWKTLGDIINPSKSKKKRGLNKLIIGNNRIEDKAEISNCMNDYFCSIGEELASNIPQGNNYNAYMKNRVNESIFLSPINEDEISVEIKKLNNKKSAGPDNISPKILKICEPFIKGPLTMLFNYSIETASYPSNLKLAKVVALHKKKSIFLPENYRPISLLSCIDKIFERLLHKRFMNFIDKHKIIILNQYGFLKKHSTVFALIDVVDYIRETIENGEYALGIYIDLKKAFDTVDHKILLSELDHYGFRGHVNKFIQSYLSDRKQFTVVNNIASNR